MEEHCYNIDIFKRQENKIMMTNAFYENNEIVNFTSINELSKVILLSGEAAICQLSALKNAKNIAIEKTTSSEAKKMLKSILFAELFLRNNPFAKKRDAMDNALVNKESLKSAMQMAMDNMSKEDAEMIRADFMFDVVPVGVPPVLQAEYDEEEAERKAMLRA